MRTKSIGDKFTELIQSNKKIRQRLEEVERKNRASFYAELKSRNEILNEVLDQRAKEIRELREENIKLENRVGELQQVREWLKKNGLFDLYENNATSKLFSLYSDHCLIKILVYVDTD